MCFWFSVIGVVEWELLSASTVLVPAPHHHTSEPQHRDSIGSVASIHSVDPATQENADASSEAGGHEVEHGSEATYLPPAHQQSSSSLKGHGSADQSGVELRPPHRAWHAACALMDDSLGAEVVIVCGGVSSGAARQDGGLCGDLWAYDPIARVWANRSPGLTTRPGSRAAAAGAGAAAAIRKGKLPAGGVVTSSRSSKRGGLSPLPRAYHTMTAVAGGQAAVLFGGRTPSADRTDDVWVLSANTFSWTSLAKPAPPPSLLPQAPQPAQPQASAHAAGDNATAEPVEDLADDDASAAPSVAAASIARSAQGHQPPLSMPSPTSEAPSFVPCPGPGPTVWHAACAASLDSELLALGYSEDELKQLSNVLPNHETSAGAELNSNSEEDLNVDGDAADDAVAGFDGDGVEDDLAGPGESQLEGEPPDDESESGSRAGGAAEHGAHEEEEGQHRHNALTPMWPATVDSNNDEGGDDGEQQRPEVVLIFGGLRTTDRTKAAATNDPSVDDDGGASVVSTSNSTVVSTASAAAASQSSSGEPLPNIGYAAPLYALDRFGRWHLVDTTDGQLSTPVGGRAVAGPGSRFGLSMVATEGMDACIVVGGVSTGQPPAYKTAAATAAAAAAAGKAALESADRKDLSKDGVALPGAATTMSERSMELSYRAGYRHQDAYALNLFAPRPDYAAMGLEDAQARARQSKVKGPQRVNITLPCGSKYDGFVNNKQQPHGNGKLWYGLKDPKNRADDFYEGSFVHGVRSGSGKVVYADGTSYEGRWAKDLPDGLGTLYCLSPQAAAAAVAQGQGRVVEYHEGSWQKGVRHGSGEAHYADGAVLRATWVQGELLRDPPLGGGGSLIVYDAKTKHKRAVITQLEFGEAGSSSSPSSASASEGVVAGVETLAPAPGGGREVYTGRFNSKGERHGGDGECVYADGSSYRGAWRSGARNGKGVFESVTTKERYEGKWVGNVRCGRGLCTYAAGHRYEGQWANGMREGTGTFFRADGECYSGEWLRGERHGHGVRTDARGRIVKESWKLGELMEEEEPSPETNENPDALSGQP